MNNPVESTRVARRFRLRSVPQPYCQVCFCPHTSLHAVHERRSDRKVAARVCAGCGYVELPSGEPDGPEPRWSRSARREREMTKLGVAVVDRPHASVFAVGADPDVLDAASTDRAPFDVVVAADVIEYLSDPRVEFAKIARLVADDGVLICSAAIHDGGPLRHRRIAAGCRSVFTAQSLRRIGAAHQLLIDFRLPPPSSKAGARRRYVIFSRSDQVMDAVADYFARHRHAPSRTARVSRRRGPRDAAGQAGTPPSALG
jgi:SAM-dependent methyltransferase